MPFVTISSGVKLHYKRVNEEGTEGTIVFLHEALGSIEQWKDFPDLLCKKTGFEGVVYERQGYGKSSEESETRGADYLHNYALKELPQFLDSLNLKTPVVLFGHSDGGSIALIFAAHFPNSIDALITEAAHVFVEKETLEGIAPAHEAFYSTEFRDKLKKYHFQQTDSVFHGWFDTWNLPEFKHWNIEATLKNITVPTMIIQGEKDEYGTLAQVDSIENNISSKWKERLIISEVGHVPHLKAKELVIENSARFLLSLKTQSF
jgi:pimeloyl-ACP methyl ester carboxylesterase